MLRIHEIRPLSILTIKQLNPGELNTFNESCKSCYFKLSNGDTISKTLIWNVFEHCKFLQHKPN